MKEMDKKAIGYTICQMQQCYRGNFVTGDGSMRRSGEGCSFTLLVRESLGKTGLLGERAKKEEG